MCISDTKGSHADLTDDYAAIRREMESVAEQFGKKVLREVDEDEFYKASAQAAQGRGGPRRACVRCTSTTTAAAPPQLCDAVREDDFETFLRLIIEGGHSSFEFNQNAYSIKNPKEQGVPVGPGPEPARAEWPRRVASAGRRLCRHHSGVCAR